VSGMPSDDECSSRPERQHRPTLLRSVSCNALRRGQPVRRRPRLVSRDFERRDCAPLLLTAVAAVEDGWKRCVRPTRAAAEACVSGRPAVSACSAVDTCRMDCLLRWTSFWRDVQSDSDTNSSSYQAASQRTSSPGASQPGRKTRAYQRLQPGYFLSSMRLLSPFRKGILVEPHGAVTSEISSSTPRPGVLPGRQTSSLCPGRAASFQGRPATNRFSPTAPGVIGCPASRSASNRAASKRHTVCGTQVRDVEGELDLLPLCAQRTRLLCSHHRDHPRKLPTQSGIGPQPGQAAWRTLHLGAIFLAILPSCGPRAQAFQQRAASFPVVHWAVAAAGRRAAGV
jgi:hypothetical protein